MQDPKDKILVDSQHIYLINMYCGCILNVFNDAGSIFMTVVMTIDHVRHTGH